MRHLPFELLNNLNYNSISGITSNLGSYNANYYVIDNFNNTSNTISRTINILSPYTKILFNSSNIQQLCAHQGTAPSIWQFQSSDGSMINGSRAVWGLSQSILNTINFNFNNNWSFITKVKGQVMNGPLTIFMDGSSDGWDKNNELSFSTTDQWQIWGQLNATSTKNISINTDNTLSLNINGTSISSTSAFNNLYSSLSTGIYIILNYYSSTNTTTVTIVSNDKNTILGSISTTAINYTIKQIPFCFTHNHASYLTTNFYHGVLYSTLNATNISNYISMFNIA